MMSCGQVLPVRHILIHLPPLKKKKKKVEFHNYPTLYSVPRGQLVQPHASVSSQMLWDITVITDITRVLF